MASIRPGVPPEEILSTPPRRVSAVLQFCTMQLRSMTRPGACGGWSCAIVAGSCAWIAQLALVLARAVGPTLAARWHALQQWDTLWYAHIVEHGYVLSGIHPDAPRQWNVAFFPVLPIVAFVVRKISGVSAPTAVLLAGQGFALMFWILLHRMFQRWEWPLLLRGIASVTVVTLPAAFFFVCGYTEPVLLASFFGFLYWTTAVNSPVAFTFGGLCGAMLTTCRLVGVPLAILASIPRLRSGRTWVLLAIAYAAFACWLLFLELRFGDWRVFASTNCAGWHVCGDWAGLWSRAIWVPELRTFAPWNQRDLYGYRVSLWLTPWVVWADVCALAVVLTRWRDERNVLWLVAQPLIWVPIISVGTAPTSQVRFQALSLVFLSLFWFRQIERRPALASALVAICLAPLLLMNLYIQLRLIEQFSHGWWVA